MTLVSVLNPSAGEQQARWLKRLRVAAGFLGVQALVQVLGFLGGVVLVRALSKEEYALYTIANAIQGATQMLAEMGVGSALSAIAGRVWVDTYRFGQLINGALMFRRKLGIAIVVISAPFGVYLLRCNQAPWGDTLTIAFLITVASLANLETSVLGIVPRFLGDVAFLQKYELLIPCGRFACLLAICWTLPVAVSSLAVAVLASTLAVTVLRRYVASRIATTAQPLEEDRVAMISCVRSLAVNTIFYCIQGQLATWLLAVFGSVRAVADLGALSRINVAYNVFGAVMASLALPSFAKADTLRSAAQRYGAVLIFYLVFGLGLIAAVAGMPDALLYVLGKKYYGLNSELLLMAVSSALGATIGAIWLLNASRGWIQHAWIYVPITIGVQVVLCSVLDVTSVRGVLELGIFSQIPALFLNLWLSLRGFRALRLSEVGGRG